VTAKGWIRFTLALVGTALVEAGAIVLLTKDAGVVRAAWIGAGAAVVAQLAGFALARVLLGLKAGLFTAWGAAMGVRFLSLLVFTLLTFKVLGLAPAPALIAFAALLLITSVVEPLFLNA